MAAGLGFKTFTTGEVLTAGDVNGYLMQGINVFATTTARNAAITAPAEGQFAFTKDTNSLWYYDGAAWVASGATGDIEGVTAGVGISGGGTSGTVTVTNSMATAIDAKGDLVPGTGADTFSRLAVGANGTVLTADSAEATGLKWATVASGGMTLLSTTSLTGSSVTISDISQSYKHLLVVIKNAYADGVDTPFIRYNGDSGANYSERYIRVIGSTVTALSNGNANYARIGVISTNTDWSNKFASETWVWRYTDTSAIQATSNSAGYDGSDKTQYLVEPRYNASAAITSITIGLTGQTFTAGTVYIYGVS